MAIVEARKVDVLMGWHGERESREIGADRQLVAAAVDQLSLATRVPGTDYYEQSMAEARLRELRSLLRIEREAEKALKLG